MHKCYAWFAHKHQPEYNMYNNAHIILCIHPILIQCLDDNTMAAFELSAHDQLPVTMQTKEVTKINEMCSSFDEQVCKCLYMSIIIGGCRAQKEPGHNRSSAYFMARIWTF